MGLTKPQTLGGGDWLNREEIAGQLCATTAIVQSTVLTIPGTIEVGRVLVPDILNRRADTPTSTVATSVAGNRLGIGGIIGANSDYFNWILPAAAIQATRRLGVVINQNALIGGPVILQVAGFCRILCADTVVNTTIGGAGTGGAVGALATVSFAADDTRGMVRLAAAGEMVIGQFVDVPRNAAGVAKDFVAGDRNFCVVDLFGVGVTARLAP